MNNLKWYKNKKWLMSIVLVLVAFGIFAITFKRGNYEAGVSDVLYFTNVDSNVVYTSEWFDATIFDGQTVYLHAYYLCATSAVDTLMKLTIEGNLSTGNSTASTQLIDTVDMVSADATDNALSVRVSGISEGDLTHITLTPTHNYPQWRFKVTGGANDATLLVALYAKVNDYIPERTGIQGSGR